MMCFDRIQRSATQFAKGLGEKKKKNEVMQVGRRSKQNMQIVLPPTDGEDEDEDEEDEDAEVVYRERAPLKRQNEVCRGSKSRKSSTSSGSSEVSVGGADTPVIQSDDEEVHADTLLLTSVPHARDEETEEEDDEERCLVTDS